MPNSIEGIRLGIGADAVDPHGNKLGTVSRMIADARTDRVTDLVIKYGTLLSHEYVVPIAHIVDVRDGAVVLDLDEDQLKAHNGFAESVRGPNPDYVGSPSDDLEGTYRGNMVFDAMWAQGAMYAMGGGKVMGYPGGEQLTPDLIQRPALTAGMPVTTSDGETVGEVGDFSIDPASGRLNHITLKRGFLITKETALPLRWLDELSDTGIVLAVPKAEVERFLDQAES